jgi:hypothetical protein
MLIVSNVVIIAGVLLAFLAATLVAACLVAYLLGVMSIGIVVGTWVIVTVSVTFLARLLSGMF